MGCDLTRIRSMRMLGSGMSSVLCIARIIYLVWVGKTTICLKQEILEMNDVIDQLFLGANVSISKVMNGIAALLDTSKKCLVIHIDLLCVKCDQAVERHVLRRNCIPFVVAHRIAEIILEP